MSIGAYIPVQRERGLAKRLVLHLGLVAVLTLALWYLGRLTGIERVVRSPAGGLHHIWLPMLGLSVYALCWLCWGLWSSLDRPSRIKAWPDLDAAWKEMRSAIAHSEVDVETVPTILVLGPLSNGVQTFLADTLGAGKLPMRPGAPFHAFVRPDAIFIACTSTCRLGERDKSRSDDAVSARLQYICELLSRECETKLPIQGIVLVIPFGASRELTNAMQADLAAIRRATGMEAPVYIAVESAELADPAGWQVQFPPSPDLDPADVPAMFQDGIDWLCLERMWADVRSRFCLDTTPSEPGRLSRTLRENIRHYQQFFAAQEWRGRLKRLLLEGTQTELSEPGMVAACYWLPGVESKSLGQAVLADMHANQSAVRPIRS